MSALEGFDKTAQKAVDAAEAEARNLGHGQVGTEHLFLALLADTASPAAQSLRAAGVTLASARQKVSEAVGGAGGPHPAPTEPLAHTARAKHAIGRAARFARHADGVGAEHLLLGVLDVEGRAGQVLRGLGTDIDRLRAALDGAGASTDDRVPELPDDEPASQPICPSCATPLDNALTYQRMPASGEQGARDVIVVSCTTCRTALAVFPANPTAKPAKPAKPTKPTKG